jgi:hypothetical protein
MFLEFKDLGVVSDSDRSGVIYTELVRDKESPVCLTDFYCID